MLGLLQTSSAGTAPCACPSGRPFVPLRTAAVRQQQRLEEHRPASRAAASPERRRRLAAASAASSSSIDLSSITPGDLRGTVVVTGAGPAGLAAAAALHRAGLPVLLLEREAALSSAGSALGLWTNAWGALEALGAADALRQQHPALLE